MKLDLNSFEVSALTSRLQVALSHAYNAEYKSSMMSSMIKRSGNNNLHYLQIVVMAVAALVLLVEVSLDAERRKEKGIKKLVKILMCWINLQLKLINANNNINAIHVHIIII